MKKDQIREHFKSLISKLPEYAKSWKEWYDRAEKTEQVNYQCDFQDGACFRARQHRTGLVKVGCCCTYCRRDRGYIHSIEESNLETYVKLFSVKTGFFREGRGCILPRKLRSLTCLGYNCRSYDFNNSLCHFLETGKGFEKIKIK